MKKTIKEIALRQNVESIVERLKKVESVPTVKIGFIGEFSTGKTSLINSMLDLNLPVDIKPCTTAITIIEPREGITDFEYFIEDSNGRRDVGFSEWSDSQNVDALGIRVKPCKVLPEGCVFVDTPGIHSVGGDEAERTYAYLSNLDAAVFCVTATDGTLNKSAVDFLLNNVPSMIRNRIVFAITHADKKAENALDEIKSHITKLIKNLGIIQNVENKIFYVSNNEEGNAEKVYKFLKSAVLEQLPKIYEDRRNQEYKDIADALLGILTEKSKLISNSGDNFSDKVYEEEAKIRKAETGIKTARAKLDNFQMTIKDKIITSLRYGNNQAVNAKTSDETRIAINNLLNNILENIKMEIEFLLKDKDFQLPKEIMTNLAIELDGRLSNIISNRDIAVTLTTMVAGAAVGGLTSAAGNVLEASLAGAAQVGAKIVGKESTRKALTNAANLMISYTKDKSDNHNNQDDQNIQKEQYLPHKNGNSAVALVCNIVQTVNPFEHVGNWIANYYKGNVFEELVAKADVISVQVTRLISEQFENEYIEPYEKAIFECKKNIERIKEDKDAFKAEKVALEEDIKLLKSL